MCWSISSWRSSPPRARCSSKRGFERTAVSDIAARVGVVEGSVFSYFPTKRDLLHEVLRALYEPLIRDVDAGYARLQGLRARLRFVVWRHVRVYVETPALARLVLHEVRTGPEYASSGLHEMHQRYTRYARLAFDSAVRDGELAGGTDAEMLRSMLYGGLEHLMWPVLHGRQRVDVDDVAERYTDRLLHGVLPSTPPDIARDTSRTAGDHEARLLRLEALVGQAPR